MKIRLSVSPLFVGLLVFSMGACKKSPPTTAVAVGADWTMCGRTNDEQPTGPGAVDSSVCFVPGSGRVQARTQQSTLKTASPRT
jgi:hypothetical protein